MPDQPEQSSNWDGEEFADGRYVVLSLLGSGGMANVYRVFDRQTNVETAVKVPKAILVADSQFSKRFHREVKFLAKMRHPHIVPLLDSGIHNDFPYAVFRYLPGGTLKDKLRSDDPVTKGKTLRETLSWLPQVATALDFLHQENVLHRDVKPENIYFDMNGNAYLGDFGVIRSLHPEGDEEQATALTAPNTVLGTCAYMSPELIMGQAPYTASVDQYSLAVTLYEALAGQRPFEGAPQQVMIQHMQATPTPLHELRPELPLALSGAVQRALSKNANERFGSCTEFVNAVLVGAETLTPTVAESRPDILAGHETPVFGTTAAAALGETGPVKPPSRRRWLAPVGVLLALGLMIAGWIVAAQFWDNGDKQRPSDSSIAKRDSDKPKKDHVGKAKPKVTPPKKKKAPPETPDKKSAVTPLNAKKKSKPIAPIIKPKPSVEKIPAPDKYVLVVSQTKPAAFRTITEAIEQSSDGDHIQIEPGIYSEKIVLTKNVTLFGAGNVNNIILESTGNSCIIMRTAEVEIKGLSIQCRGLANQNLSAVDLGQGKLQLIDCIVSSENGTAVHIHGADAAPFIQKCKMYNSIVGAEISNNAKGVFDNCDFTDNSHCGVMVKTGADPALRECNFLGVDGAGAVLIDKRGKGRFDRCNIGGTVKYGVEIGDASMPILRDCKINHCQNSGVYVHSGGNGLFVNCEISGSERSSVDVFDGNPTLRKCTITNSKYIGIEIGPKAKGVFEECEIVAAANSGIDVHGDPTFRKCTIRDGKGYGICVFQFGKGKYDGCIVKGNKQANVVSLSSRDPYFLQCKILDGEQHGVSILGSGKFEKCEVKNNERHGFSVRKTIAGKRAYVENCMINQNGNAGVSVQGKAKATITDSNLAGNRRPTILENPQNVIDKGNTTRAE